MTHPSLPRSWRRWLASKEGQSCLDIHSMGVPIDPLCDKHSDPRRAYLENRLWLAYASGWSSGAKRKVVKDLCKNLPTKS